MHLKSPTRNRHQQRCTGHLAHRDKSQWAFFFFFFFFTGCPALFDALPPLSMCLSFGVRMSAFCMRVSGLGSLANHNQAKPVPAEMSTAHFRSHNTFGHHAPQCSIFKINHECQSKLNILPLNSHKYWKLLCCNYKKNTYKEKVHQCFCVLKSICSFHQKHTGDVGKFFKQTVEANFQTVCHV